LAYALRAFFAFSSMKNAPLYEKSSKFTFSY